MAANHHVDFVRDDGTTVEVAVVARCEGYRLPWYVESHVATLPGTGTVVELTDDEVERLDDQVGENPPDE